MNRWISSFHRNARFAIVALLGALLGLSSGAAGAASLYTADGRLQLPADYRRWVFLSAGIDMSYSERPAMDMHMFDNVFADPDAWAAFQRDGSWPDQTELVMEVRGATTRGSINRGGQFQNTERMGVEVHVKDAARFAGGWAFFAFDGNDRTAPLIPVDRSCYACHREHGAVDTTFVQFYPTLLPIAQDHKTVREEALQQDPVRR